MPKILILMLIVQSSAAFSQNQLWQMQPSPLQTRWAKEVSPLNALTSYPRPQMTRKQWSNLNGLWDYAITDSGNDCPQVFDGQILVPYPLESALSGVKKVLLPNQTLWYHRSLDLYGKEKDRKYLLHFGAVDFKATIYINGIEVGKHNGGYQEFTLDITNVLTQGRNAISVGVSDPTDDGINPHGKQTLRPADIMYTSTSGIWQTVWLEVVPLVYISFLRLTPDIDSNFLSIVINTNGDPKGYTVEAIYDSGAAKGFPNRPMKMYVHGPRLWSPNDPFLYTLTIRLLKNGKTIDEIGSYFGMRKIEIKKDLQGQDRIFLNNQAFFNLGVLDQGFWPEGIYTAPTDEALRWDIEAIKSMGFNTIREHIKIEAARWYYHCDKIGILVWQDMPPPANLSPESKSEFEIENEQNMQQLHNHPSIVCWVLFNEGWNRYDQERLTRSMKDEDPSRLVDGHTGENYDRNFPTDPKQRWIESDLTDIHVYPGPGIPPKLPGKAMVIGEWGGVRVVTPQHEWNSLNGWGYIESKAAEFATKYAFMIRHLRLFEEEGLSAAIYTEPFDVETEENGLITYDRRIFKIQPEQIKEINDLIMKK